MATAEDFLDVDDDVPDIATAVPTSALFGDDEDEQQHLLEDDEEEDMGPLQLAPAVDAKEDRRAALLALLAKQKRTADAEEGPGRDKKKRKKEKGSKKDEKTEGGRPSRRDGRPRRQPGRKHEAPRPVRAAGGPEEEIASDELEESADDKEFIDDEGLAADEEEELPSGVGDDEEDGPTALLLAPEAVEAEGEDDEADDGDDPFGHKKRKRKKESEAQMANVVDDKLAKMEAAAEADMEDHERRKPATQKLKILAEVEDFLAQKKYHELFVSSGGLGVLKAWIEPYGDGSLPNARVREAILKACKVLPIDTSREDIKSQLKKSQLAARIMFLSRCSEETTANRKLATELVQIWSRPIFYDADQEAEKRRIRTQQLQQARVAALGAARELGEAAGPVSAQKAGPKFGEAGYRWHASIPQASKLDYVHEPAQDERIAMRAAAEAAAHVPEKDSRFAKKMREVQRKQKSTTARAAKPSVEGRTITLMH